MKAHRLRVNNPMNLRLTTLIIVAITFAGLSLVLSLTTRTVLMRHFDEMEQQSVLLNLERTQAAFEAEFETLDQLGQAWAGQIHDMNIELDAATLSSLDISFLVLLDPEGEPVSGVYRDGEQMRSLPASLGQTAFLEDISRLELSLQDGQGVLVFQNQPLALVVRPVGGQHGLPQGWLLVGRRLDHSALERLGNLVQLPIELVPYSPVPETLEAAAGQAFQDGEKAYIQVLDNIRIAGFGLLRDLNSEPSFLVRIEQFRVVSLNGQRAISMISVALVITGIVFALITILFLELLVTARLSRLGREVNGIRSSGSLSERVTISRRDELSHLGKDINAMMDALEQSQTHRLEAQKELSLRVADLQTLNSTAVLLLGRLEAPDTREMVCRLAVENFGADLAWIGASNPAQTRIEPEAAFGAALDRIEAVTTGGADLHDPALQAAATAQAVVSQGEVACAGEHWAVQAAFPLPVEQGGTAVLNLYKRDSGFSAESLQILEAYSNLASVALQNVLLFRQVRNGRKRLELLSRRLVELQEEERKRIAMELHDEIGQILTGLSLMLNMDLVEAGSERLMRLENARKLINDLINRVRQMSLTLRPAMLDDLGLLPTLLWHFENYTRQTGIKVQFHHDAISGQRYSSEIETAVYRVIQEALTNVARHAGVQEALVQVWVSGQVLSVQVEDEGRGFDMDNMARAAGKFGLLGMQERAVALRGSLMIDSHAGSGTTLLMQLPLKGILERRNYGRDDPAGG
jgi:signal transduction histidine kinase